LAVQRAALESLLQPLVYQPFVRRVLVDDHHAVGRLSDDKHAV
jgi:hypothetical protein